MNEKNIRLVTAESVRAGHPDKFCDQIADAILDAHLAHDPAARVAVEVFATEGKMMIALSLATYRLRLSHSTLVCTTD